MAFTSWHLHFSLYSATSSNETVFGPDSVARANLFRVRICMYPTRISSSVSHCPAAAATAPYKLIAVVHMQSLLLGVLVTC